MTEGCVATPEKIAECLAARMDQTIELKQRDAVEWIAEVFGPHFVYCNQNGNTAIDRRVLRAFRERTAGRVVWDRSLRGWRVRQPDDPPGRRAN
jgi:hypothetical protein